MTLQIISKIREDIYFSDCYYGWKSYVRIHVLAKAYMTKNTEAKFLPAATRQNNMVYSNVYDNKLHHRFGTGFWPTSFPLSRVFVHMYRNVFMGNCLGITLIHL